MIASTTVEEGPEPLMDMLQILMAMQVFTAQMRPLWDVGGSKKTFGLRNRLVEKVIESFGVIVGCGHTWYQKCTTSLL